MMPSVYLGIDPGASGGLVTVQVNQHKSRTFGTPMPTSMADVWEWVQRWGEPFEHGEPFAVIEHVWGSFGGKGEGQKGGGASNGSAMFKFGMSYGSLLMALTASGIPFEAVTPRTWQAGVSLPSRKKGELKSSFKNRGKELAQRLFPSVKVTLAISDALLICEYCRRKKTGTLGK